MSKLKIILLILFAGCSTIRPSLNTDNDYLLVIHFSGNDIENQSIDLIIDDKASFENVKFTEIPSNIYVYDIAIGYNGSTIELFSLRNEKVPLQSKRLEIKDLNSIKLGVQIDGKPYNETIDIANGTVQIVKFDDEKIEVFKAPW